MNVWRNRTMRAPILLAAATLVAVLAAIYALALDERNVAGRFSPQPMFEGLTDQLDEAGRIVYTLGRGLNPPQPVTLLREKQGWVVAERNHYPADPALVQKALLGLSGLTLYEKRTAKPEWHRNLGLLAPEQLGSAVRIQLFDQSGKSMAAVLLGKVPEQTDEEAQGAGLIYVRRDGEDQTWLARGTVPILQKAQDWLAPVFLGLASKDIKRVMLWADSARPVVISRDSASDDFAIDNIPQGRVTRGAPVVNGVAGAIADLTFDDAVPVATMDFQEGAPSVLVENFDGLSLRMVMTGGAGSLWAKISADADPGSEASEKAAQINARLSAWAYRLPEGPASMLSQNMDVLTHPGGPGE